MHDLNENLMIFTYVNLKNQNLVLEFMLNFFLEFMLEFILSPTKNK